MGQAFQFCGGKMIGSMTNARRVVRLDWLATTALTPIQPVLNAVALVAPIPVLAAALLASTLLTLAAALPAAAQDATWLASPGLGDFDTGSNWGTGTVPTGTASFGASNTTGLSFSSNTTIGGWTFNSGAAAYTFSNSYPHTLNFGGAGIVVNGGSVAITNNIQGVVQFFNSSTAGSATISNSGNLNFLDTSTAGGADITNHSTVSFVGSSTAGNAAIANSSIVTFSNTSTAGNATITNNLGVLTFNDSSTAGNATVINGRTLYFNNSSTAGNATITNNGSRLIFWNTSTAGSAAITNNNTLNFQNASTAGSATIANYGLLAFSNASFTGSAANNATAGNAAITNYASGTVDFSGSTGPAGDHRLSAGSIAGAGSYLLGANELTVGGNHGSTEVSGVISGTGGSLVKVGTGALALSGTNTYSGGTTLAGGTVSVGSDANLGGAASALTFNGGTLQVAGTSFTSTARTITWDAGGGGFDIADPANSFTVSQALGGTGGLAKLGAGTLVLSGANTYSGGTTVSGGTLTTTGTINGGLSNAATVNAAGIINGGIGNSGAFTVSGALTTNGSFTNSGKATLNVSHGDFTGITVLVNGSTDPNGIRIAASRTLGASTISNGAGAVIANSGTLTSLNAIQNAGIIVSDAGGTINADINSTAGMIGNAGTINGNVTLSGGILDFLGIGASVSGTVNLATAAARFDSGDARGVTIGSLAGVAGTTVDIGPETLTITNASSAFAGTISGSGGLTLTGGREILTGTNDYSGATIVSGGTLEVDGALTGTSSVMVSAGGRLTGTGIIDPLSVTIGAGGTLLAGDGTPGMTTKIEGNLDFESGALYVVALNPSGASSTGVTGTATLGGATVNALWASGAYVARQYTILTGKSVSGTFGATVNTNLPSGFKTALSYDASDVYLNLSLSFIGPPGTGLNINQQNVANAVTGFFNRTGSIPLVFGGLTPPGLTQISGEGATGSQQATFDAMSLFMGVMTDPFTDGRGNAGAAGGAMGYATDAADRPGDAYAAIAAKAPQAPSFGQRWNVWAAGYGGSQTTTGNAVLGSNDATSRIYGTAVGADYRLTANTIAGFALGGGGTSFSIDGLGSGRSDLFQAGAYLRHTLGASYISAALAYGWQDITTDRSVTVAGVDRLRANFHANAWSGRVEGGTRFATPWMGITPYAAAQVTTFALPAYAESVISGANTFALAYGAKTITTSRSELGLRSDKSFAMQDGIFTLRGRTAWAHDFNTDRSVAATFQTLPGASFVVNGARQASNSALTTASAEINWINGWSTAATFEGEFAQVTRSYAGKGVAHYQW
jgi:autotransporter-associated beta strand protein